MHLVERGPKSLDPALDTESGLYYYRQRYYDRFGWLIEVNAAAGPECRYIPCRWF